MNETMVKVQTKDGDTLHLPVSRTCKTCQYRNGDICKLTDKRVPVDMKKPEWCRCKKVVGYLRQQRVDCPNCRFNKYNYKDIPVECSQCNCVRERNRPYYVEIPVFEAVED